MLSSGLVKKYGSAPGAELAGLDAYILKAGDAGDISPPIFWIFRQIKLALCSETALPIVSKSCSIIA